MCGAAVGAVLLVALLPILRLLLAVLRLLVRSWARLPELLLLLLRARVAVLWLLVALLAVLLLVALLPKLRLLVPVLPVVRRLRALLFVLTLPLCRRRVHRLIFRLVMWFVGGGSNGHIRVLS